MGTRSEAENLNLKPKHMNETKTLILAGDGYQLTIAPEAEAAKAELIKHASLIVEVIDPDANAAAGNQVKKLAAMRNLVEKSRTTVKAPVLQVGKDIDAKAAEFVADIKAEEARIGKLMGSYAEAVEAERRKILREMEAQRQAEEKARREKEDAERAAEAARIAAEKAEWEAVTPEEEAKAAAALAAAEEKNKLAAEVAASISDIVKVVAIVPAKAEGVKFTVDFTVEDIDALYRYSPALVTMEAKRKDILELIKSLGADENQQIIPGIRITSKAVVSTR
jgi:hypothetical protein